MLIWNILLIRDRDGIKDLDGVISLKLDLTTTPRASVEKKDVIVVRNIWYKLNLPTQLSELSRTLCCSDWLLVYPITSRGILCLWIKPLE